QEDYSFTAEESACVGYTDGGESITYGNKEKTDPLHYNDATLISTFGNQPCDICAVLPDAKYCVDNIECCAKQYKEEWDSASLFTNEIKESACMANNNVDNVVITQQVKEDACGSGILGLFRGVRDFSLCKGEQRIEKFELGIGDDEWIVMVKVEEDGWTNSGETAAEGEETTGKKEDIWELVLKTRGYGNVNIIYEGNFPGATPENEENFEQATYIYSLLKTDQEPIETSYAEAIDVDDVKDIVEDYADYDGFIKDMYNAELSSGKSVVAYTKEKCNEIVSGTLSFGADGWPKYYYPSRNLEDREYVLEGEVFSLHGEETFIGAYLPKAYANYICQGYQPTESHILDPQSGLFKAMEAVCIPAIEGYLSMTQRLMTTMRGCINQILITGEGSAGYCQQFLSMYVCDIMYYTLSCVKKMTPGSSTATGYKSGIQGFGQYLLTSVQETQRGIENRYGSDSSMATLLSGKEVFNSACMAMFGADIDFDFGAMIDMSVQPNIEPMADISGATRRFGGVNHATGYVTYVYNVFPLLITEKDLTYNIILVCSDSYTCNPDFGYENGKCDCAGIGEQSAVIHGGRLDAGDVLGDDGDEELFEEVTSKFRYDRVVLEYSYISGQNSRVQDRGQRVEQNVESDILAVGGLAPAYCFMRISPEPEFRCNLAADEGARARFIDPVVSEEDNVKEYVGEGPLHYGDSFIDFVDIKIDVEELESGGY
ncbi:MAG: hypothetical protein KAH32_08545, partial [Chlamydiia bacterium]|nr:hypothetical protein [Chlamydiia bacterium]